MMVLGGDADYYVHEVWVQLKALDPLWCKWSVLLQFVTSFGIMPDAVWIECSGVSTK
jgi:hypothetical protein